VIQAFIQSAVAPYTATVQMSPHSYEEVQAIMNMPSDCALSPCPGWDDTGAGKARSESLPPADFIQAGLNIRLPTWKGISRLKPRPVACQRFEDRRYPVGDVRWVITAFQHEDDLSTTMLLSQFHQPLRNIEKPC
jgi:hypothetical protein